MALLGPLLHRGVARGEILAGNLVDLVVAERLGIKGNTCSVVRLAVVCTADLGHPDYIDEGKLLGLGGNGDLR